MEDDVIKVKSLVKKYGNFTAVDNISFNIKKGEIFAFLGPNGAGKTTTVEMLECLRRATSGSVDVLGFDIKKDDFKIKQRIGVLPQDFSAFEWLTVYENIDYFAQMYPKHRDVDIIIKTLDLKDKRDILFRDLSGGLKQRVGVAISLVNDPDMVFLDEPSTGLDPKARRDVWDAIKELKKEGKTVFLTTHYMDEAYHLADQICVLHKGQIIAEGTPEDLINRYGGGNTLIIRGCSQEARDELINAIPDFKNEGSSLMARLPEGDGVTSISVAASIINEGNFACEEIYVKKSTLEDVFLNLTGEKLVQGGK
ncbi:MAG: Trehalose/maltose import ATP-binding protein MalK [Methanobacterium sp. PtaU1.Bin242]|nr:MAG: Trehalose/maltose import ATP-binding protein MalK [Methanobacterium sp. PtaU1.Bin242]